MRAGARPVAVVTGASRGIGREVARQLAGHGFLVIAGARDLDAGERAARALDPAGGDIVARRLDVTDPATIAEAAGGPPNTPAGPTCWSTTPRSTTTPGSGPRMPIWPWCARPWTPTCSAPGGPRQAFLPLLRRGAHARIVNVSSEGGSISGMTSGPPRTACPRRPSTPSPGCWQASCGPTGSSSTRSARAGPDPTWAGAAAPWRRSGQRAVGRAAPGRPAYRRFLPGCEPLPW